LERVRICHLVVWGSEKLGKLTMYPLHPFPSIGYFLGGMTLLAAFLCLFLLGTPSEVFWLSKRDKLIANARILENHAGTDRTGRRRWDWGQVREAFKDPQMYFSIANTFLSVSVRRDQGSRTRARGWNRADTFLLITVCKLSGLAVRRSEHGISDQQRLVDSQRWSHDLRYFDQRRVRVRHCFR
jgi:hypothetical protein